MNRAPRFIHWLFNNRVEICLSNKNNDGKHPLVVGLIIYRNGCWKKSKRKKSMWEICERKKKWGECWINYFRTVSLDLPCYLVHWQTAAKELIRFGSCVSSLLHGSVSNCGCSATLYLSCFKQKLLLWPVVACAKTQDIWSNGAVVRPHKKAS